MNWLRAIWNLIRNAPIKFTDADGTVVDSYQADRREHWEMLRPGWTYTICARRLPCGCTRRWWGSFTLYNTGCWRRHFD